jgi:hypothetical protein
VYNMQCGNVCAGRIRDVLKLRSRACPAILGVFELRYLCSGHSGIILGVGSVHKL